jgi:hypothetical protein
MFPLKRINSRWIVVLHVTVAFVSNHQFVKRVPHFVSWQQFVRNAALIPRRNHRVELRPRTGDVATRVHVTTKFIQP